MRPVQAALLTAVLVLMCAVIWWMTRLDGTTPRTAAPLSIEAQAREDPSASPGDLSAPTTQARPLRHSETSDERAVVGSDGQADPKAASEDEAAYSGRVFDHLEQPVAGAAVYLGRKDGGFASSIELDALYNADSDWGGEVIKLETDALGRYTVESPKWNPARVAVRAAGHAPYSGELVRPARGEDYADIRLHPSVILEGRVFDHLGRPVEDAQIEALPPRTNGIAINLMPDRKRAKRGWYSDASGRFVIDQVVAGPYRLRVTHPSAPVEEVGGSTATPGERVTGIEVHLGEGGEIRGHVVGIPEGEASKYVVVAQPADMDFGAFAPDAGRSAVLSDDGSFRLRGLRKGTQVRLALYEDGAENLFWGESLAEEKRAMPGDVGVALQFIGTTRVRLRAVDASTGEAIEQYRLEAGGWWKEPLTGEDGLAITEHPDGISEHGGFNTRDDGSFDVTVRAKGFEPFERKGLRADAGERLDLGDVRLKRVPELTVKVIDHVTGEAIDAARVTLFVHSGDGSNSSISWNDKDEESGKTDERGIARLSSRPGKSVSFNVSHKHYADHKGEPVVLTDLPDQVHEVRMLRGGTVAVLVVDENGGTLAGRQVSHRPEDATQDELFEAAQRPQKSDESGKVTFEHLPAGVHYFRVTQEQANSNVFVSFSVDSDGNAPLDEDWKPVAVVEGGVHQLKLYAPPSAGLTGRILENGRPLVGARLSLEARDEDGKDAGTHDMLTYSGFPGSESGVKTDADGRFEFDDETVGPARLTIQHPLRAMPALFDLVLEAGANEVELDLDVTILRGRVTDEDGKPVVSANVSVRRADASNHATHEVFTIMGAGALITGGVGLDDPILTDADGRYELRGVAAGAELVINISAKDALLKDDSLEVAALTPREERELKTVQLVRGGSLRVAVSAADGTSVSFCNVRLDPREVEGEEDSKFEFLQGSGDVLFSGLSPGEWAVVASSIDPSDGSETESETQTVTIEAGSEARATLVLR